MEDECKFFPFPYVILMIDYYRTWTKDRAGQAESNCVRSDSEVKGSCADPDCSIRHAVRKHWMSEGMKYTLLGGLASIAVIIVLLFMSGIEPNPGPRQQVMLQYLYRIYFRQNSHITIVMRQELLNCLGIKYYLQ